MQTDIVQEGLFGQPVLTDGQGIPTGPYDRMGFDPVQCLNWHVLELVCDDVSVCGKGLKRGQITIGCRRRLSRRDVRWSVCARLEHMRLKAKPRGGHRQHAAKLTSAKNADRVAGGERLSHPAAPPEWNSTGPDATPEHGPTAHHLSLPASARP